MSPTTNPWRKPSTGEESSMSFAEIRKTVAAGCVAFGGALTTAAVEGGVTGTEWYVIIGTTVAAIGAVWYVPNTPKG